MEKRKIEKAFLKIKTHPSTVKLSVDKQRVEKLGIHKPRGDNSRNGYFEKGNGGFEKPNVENLEIPSHWKPSNERLINQKTSIEKPAIEKPNIEKPATMR